MKSTHTRKPFRRPYGNGNQGLSRLSVVEGNSGLHLEEFDFWERINQHIEESLRCIPPATIVYLSVPEAASLLRKSKQSIYNDIHKGVFIEGKHYFKSGGKVLLMEAALLDFIQIKGPKATTEPKIMQSTSGQEQSVTPTQQKNTVHQTPYVII